MTKISVVMMCVLIGFFNARVKASETDSTKMKQMPFQITLVTPLGTNGMASWSTDNRFSMNLFSGFNGGLHGVEFSGFAGIIKSEMQGVQFSGFANVNLSKSHGAMFSGFANVNKGRMQGAQFAGFANVVTDSAKAFQAAGFANVTNGSQDGAQIAGFANVVKGNSTSFQAAGFANVTHGDSKGGQVAGFANVATDDVHGAQIAGFINVAKKVKGVQIGVINYADSISDGVAIGFISIVKHGYRAFEIGANESMYANLRFKTGTRAFYSILGVGASLHDEKVYWGWEAGFGTLIKTSEKTALSVEASTMHINEDEWFTDRLNLLNKFRTSFAWQFHENFSVYCGASWNVLVSKNSDNGEVFETPFVPWTVYDDVHKNTRVQMYPGFQLGIRINN